MLGAFIRRSWQEVALECTQRHVLAIPILGVARVKPTRSPELGFEHFKTYKLPRLGSSAHSKCKR
ncbi:MAG: hypothetical protein C5B58_10105 [Acidobacteria bacterium]|nr:MAG: hypothetical protein C5B58_10105 [Acidobacteriota bacterium]